MACGQDTELEGAASCDSRVEAGICTGDGELAPACNCWREYSAERIARVVRVIPLSGAKEAAVCTEVRPCEHGKTAKTNTENASAARSCGAYRHRHVNKKRP